jgi:hypothetical protein
VEEALLTFDCPSCGHVITPAPLEGLRGNQIAVCPTCQASFTRTFAFFADEWVFGMWRSSETGKVACTYYKTAFGASDVDC